MDYNTLKKANQELENQVNDKLDQLDENGLHYYAQKERKSILIEILFFGIFIGSVGIISLCLGIFGVDDDQTGKTIVIILGIVSIVLSTLFILFGSFDRKKSDKVLASRKIRRDLSKHIINKVILDEEKSHFSDPNFVISKTINIKTSSRWTTNKFFIDNINKKFIYCNDNKYSKAYRFTDIINYEVYENGKSKVQGRAGSALIGGAFFGLGGLIVGSSMSKNIDELCNNLKLIIRLNDFENPQISITFLENVNADKSSPGYKTIKENLQLICSNLEFMINDKFLEQSAKMDSSFLKDNKEELKNLKELFDNGLITEEEYTQKKKQILGL